MKLIKLHKDLEQNIREAQRHNQKAQYRLYRQFAPKMLSVCRLYISDLHHAEDVMSTGFVKVFKNLHRFEHKGSFEGWVRRIMVTTAIDFLRQQKDIEFSTDEVEHFEVVRMPGLTEWSVEELQEVIDELPEGYRLVFTMHVIEDYTHKAIAETLNITEATSRSQLFKARRLLKTKLETLSATAHGQV
ncbi:sigma-70 family RNA polymerase sigma factor [Psychroflexus sp. YR1-1]|uniref:Sigma-70 family RNA polymerase sigma factor n=1 Tax=Psychroflexus aurantiacus TaxID=2709310 RepID=A0A6B3QZQ5_9FLAO|nr:sigma-70 family RNA polymerase sigma factor [Psychroflexus aurantiacus]NEV93332.1 sigma-70 family RNA polymerase sigma factor [Psychroflexus aurantiacus]